MPSRNRNKIHKALIEKGFHYINGTKHDIYILTFNGKKQQISTFMSRGSKYRSYGTDLLKEMSRELKMNINELVGFVDCTIKYENYIALLKEKKLL
jgi:hypothetical protein